MNRPSRAGKRAAEGIGSQIAASQQAIWANLGCVVKRRGAFQLARRPRRRSIPQPAVISPHRTNDEGSGAGGKL